MADEFELRYRGRGRPLPNRTDEKRGGGLDQAHNSFARRQGDDRDNRSPQTSPNGPRCAYCRKLGHVKTQCWELNENTVVKNVGFVMRKTGSAGNNKGRRSKANKRQSSGRNNNNEWENRGFQSFMSKGHVTLGTSTVKPVAILRDTGTNQSLMEGNSAKYPPSSRVGNNKEILQTFDGRKMSVPLHRVKLECDLVKGEAPRKIEVDSRSVFVGNVEYGATAEELKQHFHGYGSINRVTILCDRYSGHPKGFAYVEFGGKDSKIAAMARDRSRFRGRKIKVVPKRTNKPGMSLTNLSPRGHDFVGKGGGRGEIFSMFSTNEETSQKQASFVAMFETEEWHETVVKVQNKRLLYVEIYQFVQKINSCFGLLFTLVYANCLVRCFTLAFCFTQCSVYSTIVHNILIPAAYTILLCEGGTVVSSENERTSNILAINTSFSNIKASAEVIVQSAQKNAAILSSNQTSSFGIHFVKLCCVKSQTTRCCKYYYLEAISSNPNTMPKSIMTTMTAAKGPVSKVTRMSQSMSYYETVFYYYCCLLDTYSLFTIYNGRTGDGINNKGDTDILSTTPCYMLWDWLRDSVYKTYEGHSSLLSPSQSHNFEQLYF
ncbi:Polyadenylate-binding protein 2 [Nymphon striatum]|nr:Polyadenylate-binding protein 2 [Nymphon striatum]